MGELDFPWLGGYAAGVMAGLWDDISEEQTPRRKPGRPPAGSPPTGRPPIKPTIQTIRYTHDAVIDIILTNPSISQNELAQSFGYSVGWMSIIINSDAFQERMTERKAELVDPKLRATIAEKVDGLANRALDRLIDRLDSPTHGAIKTQDLVSIAKLAVAPKTPQIAIQQNNTYVAALPTPARDSQSWLQNLSQVTPRGPLPIAEEVPRG